MVSLRRVQALTLLSGTSCSVQKLDIIKLLIILLRQWIRQSLSFLLGPAVGTAGSLLEPWENALIVEDVLAVEQPDHFALYKPFYANRALLVTLANLHLLYPLQPLRTHAHQLLLQAVLFQPELHRILQHQIVKRFPVHTIDGRLLRRVFPVVVAVDDGFILVLVVDKVQVVLACGIKLYRSVCHLYLWSYQVCRSETFGVSVTKSLRKELVTLPIVSVVRAPGIVAASEERFAKFRPTLSRFGQVDLLTVEINARLQPSWHILFFVVKGYPGHVIIPIFIRMRSHLYLYPFCFVDRLAHFFPIFIWTTFGVGLPAVALLEIVFLFQKQALFVEFAQVHANW